MVSIALPSPGASHRARTAPSDVAVPSRARKIRCDGAKPICCNCQKRSSNVDQCSYDSGPNRRGPDKGRRGRAAGRALPPATSRAPRRARSPQEAGPQDASESEAAAEDMDTSSGPDEPSSQQIEDESMFEITDVCMRPRIRS